MASVVYFDSKPVSSKNLAPGKPGLDFVPSFIQGTLTGQVNVIRSPGYRSASGPKIMGAGPDRIQEYQ